MRSVLIDRAADWALQLGTYNFTTVLMHVGGQNVYYNVSYNYPVHRRELTSSPSPHLPATCLESTNGQPDQSTTRHC